MKPRLLVPLYLTVLLVASCTIAASCGGGGGSDVETSPGEREPSDDAGSSSESVPEVLFDLLDEFQSMKDDLGIPPGDFAGNQAWLEQADATLGLLQSIIDEAESLQANEEYGRAGENLSRAVTSYNLFVVRWAQGLLEGDDDALMVAIDHYADHIGYLEDLRDDLVGFRDDLGDRRREVLDRLEDVEGQLEGIQSNEPEDDGDSSPGSGSSVPLYSSNVLDFSKGVVRASAGQLEAANRELDRVIDSGQQVISCQYGPSDPEAQTGYQSYGFWYEDVPDNIDALLLVAGDSGVPDPVRHLGTNSISSCPDSRDEGEAAWRAGRS